MRSILMNAWSIQVILAGHKTQTRRVMKIQPISENGIWRWKPRAGWDVNTEHINGAMSPWGKPGDSLWVREGYKIQDGLHFLAGGNWQAGVCGFYLADRMLFTKALTASELAKWRARKYPYRASPGRFMYRSLSRITLEILSVRAEQIQDITEEDAIAEGERPVPTIDNMGFFCARGLFQNVWNDIHKHDGYDWDGNPWVWALEFKMMSPGD